MLQCCPGPLGYGWAGQRPLRSVQQAHGTGDGVPQRPVVRARPRAEAASSQEASERDGVLGQVTGPPTEGRRKGKAEGTQERNKGSVRTMTEIPKGRVRKGQVMQKVLEM